MLESKESRKSVALIEGAAAQSVNALLKGYEVRLGVNFAGEGVTSIGGVALEWATLLSEGFAGDRAVMRIHLVCFPGKEQASTRIRPAV